MKLLAKSLAFLLLLTGISSAASACSVSITSEASLIILLALLSGLIVALAYMGSQVFQKFEWEIWAKNTGVRVLVALALVFGVNMVILAGCAASDALVGKDMFDASNSYLGNLVYSRGFPLIYTLTEASLQNQLEAIDFKFTSSPFSGGSGIAAHAGEKTKANAQDAVVNMLMPLMASLYAQQLLLQAIQTVIVPVFLPFAFVLRVFSQTRTVGDYLIAICLGLAVVLPLTYVMNLVIVGGMDMANILTPSMAADPDLKLASVTSLIPQAIFLPNLTIVVTVSFIMSFSKLLSRGFEVEAPNA
ncbi:MAG: hypothetical protein Q7T16_01670 [Candidatus Burarchaeum sp.]|nr:hypothetical protein [Candidatus Burarchaeum sp.]MDO8339343.1 hypothetical protein [Candidatus Burarchaeum sp.]